MHLQKLNRSASQRANNRDRDVFDYFHPASELIKHFALHKTITWALSARSFYLYSALFLDMVDHQLQVAGTVEQSDRKDHFTK